MNYSGKFADITKALVVIVIALFSINSCTEVDDELGGSLIPDGQTMNIRIDTLTGIKTFLHKEDSLKTSGLGSVYFGQEYSSIFGRRKNSFIMQFLPASIPYEYGFGLDPIVDSLYMIFPVSECNGDSTLTQKFDVYGMEGDNIIHPDSTYYGLLFPWSDYRLSAKLFSFTHKGKRDVGARLEPTEEGRLYLESLVKLDTAIYKSDSLFRLAYKGLYVTPSDDSPSAAATYSSKLDDAYMVLYVRNHDSLDRMKIKDTLSASFHFSDEDEYYNASVNIIDFDYTGSTLGAIQTSTSDFTDTTDLAEQPLMYVQTMGGVSGYLRFTDELIERLRAISESQTHDIMINQARMYISLDMGADGEAPYKVMDAAQSRLGSYTNLKSFVPIPDYQYTYEASTQMSNSSYVLPYNGYLNRSSRKYAFNVTSYVQQLAKSGSKISQWVSLAPEAYGFFGFGQMALKGSLSEEDIEIIVTYTLIDK